MHEPSLFRIWYRWSFTLGFFVALFLAFYSKSGPVPTLHGISRWWDVFAPAVIAGGLLSSFWFADLLEYQLCSDTPAGILVLIGIVAAIVALILAVMGGILYAIAAVVAGYLIYLVGFLIVMLASFIMRIQMTNATRTFGEWLCDIRR